jgi:hypothetical protein
MTLTRLQSGSSLNLPQEELERRKHTAEELGQGAGRGAAFLAPYLITKLVQFWNRLVEAKPD